MLTQATGEYEGQLAALTQALHHKDAHINNLNRMALHIQQLQVNTAQLSYRLDQVHTSPGWRLFKPLRAIKRWWMRFNHRLIIDLIPFNQLQRNGNEWQSTGNDPQFLVMAERAWHGLAGWYWLKIDILSAQPLNAKFYFDTGEGFDPALTISFLLSGEGLQRIPLHVPPLCRAIRLDPCDEPATFKLSVPELTLLKEAPELSAEFSTQSGVYEMLGGRSGNASSLVPTNGVRLNNETDYCWRSEGADPWFVIEGLRQRLRPGWYMIELRICADSECGNAVLYFDHGNGYSESAQLTLPFMSGQIAKRLYHLESIPKQIRFDPIDRASKFSIKHLNFVPVLHFFARNRMLRRLHNHNTVYKDFSFGHIWKDLQAHAKSEKTTATELLLQMYSETFTKYSLNSSISYTEWISKFETLEFSNLAAIRTVQQNFRHRPTVSVVMPTYNTTEAFLRLAIESVLNQSYPNWELCIADDASTAPHVRAVLEEYAQHDSRIKVTFRSENGHISAASNSALALATGDYIALLDHDDELSPHALHFVVEAINQNLSAQVIYSDEDKIDDKGNRSDPHFKSDWNPDLFFSQNYISHLGVYRRALLQQIGGFHLGVEGSQDQDLLLRCLPHVKSKEIIHIPKILYHWRMLEGSTAMDSGEKNYTTAAGIKALQDFFNAQGRDDVTVEAGLVPNTYHVRYPIPQPEPLVSLLIPTRDMLVVLEPCLRSILDLTTYKNFEIIILDNESVEPATLQYFERIQAEDARVKVLPYHHPFNYSAINNFGVQHAKGEVIGLINNDIEVISPEWLTEMVSHALRPEIGCVGAKLYYDDETIQHAGVILGLGGVAGHSHKYFPREASGYFHRLKIVQNLSAVTAACLVVRKSIYRQVGGLEEEGLRVAFNDVDFCLKVREAGYRNLWTPYAELYHHESKSRGTENTPEKVERFNKEIEFIKSKWGDTLLCDPCYSVNLTLAKEDFSIR